MAQRKVVVRFAPRSPTSAEIESELRRRTGLTPSVTVPSGYGSGTVAAPPPRPVDISLGEDTVVIYADPGPLRYLEEALLSCLVGMGGSYSGSEAKPPDAIRPWKSLPWWQRRRS
jgi:hypothetical protein